MKNIRNKKEFYDYADDCYKRTNNLKEVWMNGNETRERKSKAFSLWVKMIKLIVRLTSISVRLK